MRPIDWFLLALLAVSNGYMIYNHRRWLNLTNVLLKCNAFLIGEIRKLKGIDPPEPSDPFWRE
jgi:hypothetical protein